MKDFLNNCIYPALSAIIVGALTWIITKRLKVKKNTTQSSPVVAIHLSDLDKRILKILAEGGRAVPALDEHGVVIQVNIYGHPKQDSIDCVAEETLTSYRWLLQNRLIAEDFRTGQREYVATETGRQIGIEYPTPIWPQ